VAINAERIQREFDNAGMFVGCFTMSMDDQGNQGEQGIDQ
jgi:hypothetical protein